LLGTYYIISVSVWSIILIFYLHDKIVKHKSLPPLLDIRGIVVSIIISPLCLGIILIVALPVFIVMKINERKLKKVLGDDIDVEFKE